MKCKTCKSESKLYKYEGKAYCRNHFPGSDPLEHETKFDTMGMSAKEVYDQRHLSIEHGWDLDGYPVLDFPEAMGLSAWHMTHPRPHEFRKRQKEIFSLLRDKLEKAFSRGAIQRRLSKQQLEIFKLLVYQKLSTSSVAKLLHTSVSNIDNQIEKIGEKLEKFFKKVGE